MNTSRAVSKLSEPIGTEKISSGTFGYFRGRNRHRLYSLVVREFQKSGLSQANLARRMGKGTDVICRWLAAPSNWEADTLSDLLFAISGAAPVYTVEHPLAQDHPIQDAPKEPSPNAKVRSGALGAAAIEDLLQPDFRGAAELAGSEKPNSNSALYVLRKELEMVE